VDELKLGIEQRALLKNKEEKSFIFGERRERLKLFNFSLFLSG
jgi:hypothetical protein